MHIKKEIISLMSISYAKLISLNLCILNKIYKNLCYNHSLGFGDSFCYYITYYTKIKKASYVIDFSYLTSDLTNFFFEKNKIKKIFFFIFKFFPHYNIRRYLIKSKNFKPNFFNKEFKKQLVNNTYLPQNKDSIKNLIIAKFNKGYDKNFNAKEIFGKNYFCIGIKTLPRNDFEDLTILRATNKLDVIISVINYLTKNNYKICILGQNNELSVIKLKKILSKVNSENIKFLADYSKNYSFVNQVDTCLNSLGYIGSPSGISVIFYYLQKKSVLLNSVFKSYIHNNYIEHEIKFNKYLDKKIKINNSMHVLTLNNYKSVTDFYYDDVIIENSFAEILYQINNFLLNKN